ncbi:MAG TPA: PEGA domain-containing protein [Pirellulales bacterium]
MWNFTGANCFYRWGSALAVLALAAGIVGCVERRMTIRSNPPGAQVYVDDYEIGTAPVSSSYTYYGTRKIRLVKDGYETMTIHQPMPAPWYDWPGVDFFSENLWPHKIRDERAFDYQMMPIVSVPTEELRSRAEQLRSASQVVPAAAAQPIGTPPAITPPPAFQPEALPPPVNTAPAMAPQSSLPPNFAPSPNFGAPPANSYPPPGGFGPTMGNPAGMQPASPYPAPSTAPMPNYSPPGGAPSNTPALPPSFGQPPVPPGWRPIGEAETPLQR